MRRFLRSNPRVVLSASERYAVGEKITDAPWTVAGDQPRHGFIDKVATGCDRIANVAVYGVGGIEDGRDAAIRAYVIIKWCRRYQGDRAGAELEGEEETGEAGADDDNVRGSFWDCQDGRPLGSEKAV